MKTPKIAFIALLCSLSLLLFFSCKKTEPLFQYHFDTPPDDATKRDTAISVTALLNNDTFKAIGRSRKPDSIIKISLFDFNSDAFLEIAINGDTLGTYPMGRNISDYTAVYYPNAGSKQQLRGFTSRATDSAGGQVTITSIDTVNHKIKGTFELLLLSRTDSARYAFKTGSFDILYNYAEMVLDTTSLVISKMPGTGLANGSATVPEPHIIMELSDSAFLSVKIFAHYQGPGDYTVKNDEDMLLNIGGKEFYSKSGTARLIRFNYGEFIQATFNGEFVAGDGEKRSIKSGAFVIGNL